MKRHWALRIAFAAGLALSASCAKTTDEPADTNTDWMNACAEDAQCDGDASCLCGVCTRSCEEASECRGVHEASTCLPLHATACGYEHLGMSACLQDCDLDEDCGAFDDRRCVGHICVPRSDAVTKGCFSPELNTDKAKDPGFAGCECSHENAQVCVGETAFACVTGPGITAWELREDDALCSEPGLKTCLSSLRRTLQGCLDRADACYQQEDGRYCGFHVDGSSIDPLGLGRVNGTIVVPEAFTYCEHHRDCVMVETSCDGCCGQTAIQVALGDKYAADMPAACEGYEGPECDCSYEDLVARCVDERCAAVPREELECFAPEHNDDSAYETGAVGCRCDVPGKSICTGPAALICEHLTWDVYTWFAVEDGPCGEPEPDPSCGDGELRETAEACLAEFDKCHRVPSGEYCGELL